MARNKKIETMLEEIRKRGGVAGVSEVLDDQAAEFFLQQILDCPDCREEAERNGAVPPSRRDH